MVEGVERHGAKSIDDCVGLTDGMKRRILVTNEVCEVDAEANYLLVLDMLAFIS